MAGSSWKVAYADFMTAMMAFFLVMWLLNMAPKETLRGLAGIFSADATALSNTVSPYAVPKNPLIQYVADKLDTREFNAEEVEKSNYAIAQSLKQFLTKDAVPESASGINSDSVGVLLRITADLMFKPGTVEFTPEGEKVMQEVIKVMDTYKVYLVVRGHADASESGAPYPSKWELSAARGNSAVRYVVEHGVSPNLVRSVAYADTQPQVPSTVPGAAARNSRVEFNFHRPEVMSTL